MEEEEELLQVRQHLEHTVWSVGVHLGKDRQRSNIHHQNYTINYISVLHPFRQSLTHSMACGVFSLTQRMNCDVFSEMKMAAVFTFSRPCSMSGPTTLTHSE